MSDQLQPVIHPDADSLSAFIEGVLPAHEREACLAHLAECAVCREIVYAAQEPAPEPASAPVSVPPRKRWFVPASIFAAAAAATILITVVVRAPKPALETPPPLVAENRPQAAELGSPARGIPVPSTGPVAKKTAPSGAPVVPRRSSFAAPPTAAPPATPPSVQATTAAPEPAPLAAAPPPQAPAPRIAPVPLPPPGQQAFSAAARSATINVEQSSGITGSVTDAGGAAIPGATVTVRPATGATITAQADNAGQFSFVPLPPGRYDVLVTKPGFQSASRQVEVQPQLIAKANSQLSVGSVSEQVTVEAQSALVNTQSLPLNGRVARTITPAPLPSRLDATTTAQKGKTILSADASGVLFFSNNSGKSWKAVKPVWQGKVIRVGTPPDSSAPPKTVFELTTDSGTTWFSRDGNRWTHQ